MESLNQALATPVRASNAATARKVECAECGEQFETRYHNKQFCCAAHKTAFQNRQAVEGRAIIAMAKAWRIGRNIKGKTERDLDDKEVSSQAFSELCAILDNFITSDRLAGRPKPIGYARALLEQGRYMDRQR